MAIYVAKAIRCDTNQTVEFNAGDVCLPEWMVNSSFQQPEMFNEFDDLFITKDPNQISLKIGIACDTTDDARRKAEEICSVLSRKAKLYLFDDRYTYVMPRNFSPKFPDDTITYVDMTINLTASPYFYKDVVKECIITPSDYPTRVELENPDPRVNVQYGNYNVTTGAKVSDSSGWSIATSVAGYSGSGYVITQTVGDGLTFTCLGRISLRLYRVIGRKVKIFEGFTLLVERTFTDSSAAWGDIEVTFADTKLHTVTVVHVEGAALAIDYVDFVPSSVQILANGGTVDSYPVIELAPLDTAIRYNSLGKIAGDANPVTIRFGGGIALPTSPAMGTEIAANDYAKVAFVNSANLSYSTLTNGYYYWIIVEYNLKAAKSGIPSTWTPDEIKSSLQSITCREWAYGAGANNGVLAYGLDVYLWRATNGTWIKESTHTQSTIYQTVLQSGVNLNYPVTDYITSDGKCHVLIRPQYPGNGTIASAIYLNYCDIEVKYNRVDVGTDLVINRAVNLVPLLSQWTIHANALVTSAYTLEHIKSGTVAESSSIKIPVLPSTTYSFSGEGYGFYADEQTATGTYIKTAFNSGTKNITFKTSPTTYLLALLAYLPAGTTGTYTFSAPMLTRTDTAQPFAPQKKYSLSISQSQALLSGKRLTFQAENDVLTANGMNLIPYAGIEYLSKGFLIEPGTNHLQFNHSGSLMKATVKYREKFNSP